MTVGAKATVRGVETGETARRRRFDGDQVNRVSRATACREIDKEERRMLLAVSFFDLIMGSDKYHSCSPIFSCYVTSATGHEAKVGGSDEAISRIAVPRRHVTEGAEEGEDGTRVATARERHCAYRAASAHIRL